MNFILSLIASIICSLSVLTDASFSAVEQAFGREDATKIISYGKDKVLLQIQGKEGVYAQSQATQLLKDFFNRKPVSSFRFTFKGKESDDSPLTTGIYTSKSESFRVTIKWKHIGLDLRIESLSIE
ncbi:DUF4783 domain-containing protein [Fluviicola taffensis]|uniref:DUF4783 domain-containing protein n=1 Tax=Fluviicola taffensis (strain DSM 16823 / NCIMB 13979 / RW262) TaxID=755732 RepID=F2II17_FLUTR|nr:DUF4783 domain-containing protein [Fluviicola taffensis]AEA42717.1 hypothetical protein Fluta_0713 [Fluviicola taffensis DSM 16823]